MLICALHLCCGVDECSRGVRHGEGFKTCAASGFDGGVRVGFAIVEVARGAWLLEAVMEIVVASSVADLGESRCDVLSMMSGSTSDMRATMSLTSEKVTAGQKKNGCALAEAPRRHELLGKVETYSALPFGGFPCTACATLKRDRFLESVSHQFRAGSHRQCTGTCGAGDVDVASDFLLRVPAMCVADATPQRTMTHVQLRFVMYTGHFEVYTRLVDAGATLIDLSSHTSLTCSEQNHLFVGGHGTVCQRCRRS